MPIAATNLAEPPITESERGSVMVEYAVLLTVVAMAVAFATVALGIPLTSMYFSQRTWLLLPYP
jgi:Flp pilus assembly pilin Flp